MKRPKIFLYLFLKFYLLLVAFGVSKLPKVKGLFYHIYGRIKDKKGMITLRVNNYKMRIDISDVHIATKLIQYGYWEKGVTDLIKKTVKPGMVIVDLGAHAGYYSLLFSGLAGDSGKVFCFEPEPHNFEILKNNIAINGKKNIVPEKLAVSDKNGDIRLFLEKDNLGGHSIIDRQNLGNYVYVKTVKLDDYFDGKDVPVDLIKMDIECAEILALRGMSRILEKNNDIFIIMEFYPSGIIKGGYDPMALFNQLQSSGFNIFVIDNQAGTLEKATDVNKLMERCGDNIMNLLCARRDLAVF